MREGIVWCPHCREPHKLGEAYCPKSGQKLDQRIHHDSYIRAKLHPLIGVVIDGKYEILKRIGVGGMGEVFEAHNQALDRRVALKIVTKGKAADAADRLRREARVIASVKHPNICDLYDVGTMPDGTPYMVLELLTGETLHARVRREKRLTVSDAIDIFCQILSGVQHAHANSIVHRDLKPANVFLVERYGLRPLVKLVDFGLAVDLLGRMHKLTQPGRSCGTPHYMSPEQLRGRPVDARSDLFSIGLMLFEALSGRHPFAATAIVEMTIKIAYEEPTELAQLRKRVPPALAAIVERTLEKDPDRRPQSAMELQTALAALDLPDDEDAPHSSDSGASFPRLALDSSYSSG
jgi:serine/threonine-protein kinase